MIAQDELEPVVEASFAARRKISDPMDLINLSEKQRKALDDAILPYGEAQFTVVQGRYAQAFRQRSA